MVEFMTRDPRGERSPGHVPADVVASALPATDEARTSRAVELAPKIRAFAARVLGVPVDHPDAEDCAQETLARWCAQERSDAPNDATAFVFGIARNVAIDHVRRRARRRETLESATDSQSDLGKVASHAASPEEAGEARLDQERLARAMLALPENQRRALRMFYLERRTYEDIAEHLGVPLGTVATWLARGKSRLSAILSRGEA